MDPFTIMMIAKGAQAVMGHQAQNAAASAANLRNYKQKLMIKKAYETKLGHARQAVADTNIMRQRNLDIKADAQISSTLQQMKAHAAVKASGLAEGQSTDGLLRQANNTILKGHSKFLKDMDMKAAQLDYRDKEIQQGMDMAFLEADQQMASLVDQSGPGAMGLAMGLGGAALDAYTFGQQTDSEFLGTGKYAS